MAVCQMEVMIKSNKVLVVSMRRCQALVSLPRSALLWSSILYLECLLHVWLQDGGHYQDQEGARCERKSANLSKMGIGSLSCYNGAQISDLY